MPSFSLSPWWCRPTRTPRRVKVKHLAAKFKNPHSCGLWQVSAASSHDCRQHRTTQQNCGDQNRKPKSRPTRLSTLAVERAGLQPPKNTTATKNHHSSWWWCLAAALRLVPTISGHLLFTETIAYRLPLCSRPSVRQCSRRRCYEAFSILTKRNSLATTP